MEDVPYVATNHTAIAVLLSKAAEIHRPPASFAQKQTCRPPKAARSKEAAIAILLGMST